jgi:acyl-CoA dehydrogenase
VDVAAFDVVDWATVTTDTVPATPGIDFTIPPDLRELLDRVRSFVEEEALPAEAEIEDPEDVLASWHVVDRLRDRARERGIYTPHLPEEWGV